MLHILRKPIFYSMTLLFVFCLSVVAFILFVLIPECSGDAVSQQAGTQSAAAPLPGGDALAKAAKQPAPVQTGGASPHFPSPSDPFRTNVFDDESFDTAGIPITISEPYEFAGLSPDISISQRNINIGSTPEPATLILIASGVSGIAFTALRRRRRATGGQAR